MKNTIKIFVLMLALAVSAFAQFAITTVEDTPDSVQFSGDETNRGNFVPEMTQVTENTFVYSGSSRTFSSVLMTVSFNYNGELDFQNGNLLTGGRWNMAIYRNGEYAGSVYGEVVPDRGLVAFEMTGPESGTRITTSMFLVRGGTGEFSYYSEGELEFEGRSDIETGAGESVVRRLNLR